MTKAQTKTAPKKKQAKFDPKERHDFIVVAEVPWKGGIAKPGELISFCGQIAAWKMAKLRPATQRERMQAELREVVEKRAAAAKDSKGPGRRDSKGGLGEAPPTLGNNAQAREEQGERVQRIALSLILPSPRNPRKKFDGPEYDELVQSVKEKGVIQPLLVRSRKDGGFELIAGERRWRASKQLDLATAPVIVRDDLDDTAAAEMQAIENLTRADLSPIEEAHGYRTLLDLPGYTIDRLEAATGRKRNTIYGKLKLLDCPEDVQKAVVAGVLADATAEAIGRLKGEAQEKAAKAILHPHKHDLDDGQEVLTHREALREIEEIKEKEKAREERQAVFNQLVDAGLQVLSEEENAKATNRYSSYSKVLSGYVLTSEKCPRDPQGRTWQAVLKGNPDVVMFGLVHAERAWNGSHYTHKFTGLRAYNLQEANEALKAAGLWDAEGSKKALELEEKRQAKAAEKARVAKMHADLDKIVREAEALGNTGLVRPVIELAIRALTAQSFRKAEFVAKRRKEMNPTDLPKLLDRMGRAQMVGLLAELATCFHALSYGVEPDERGLKQALAILGGGESAHVRTEGKVAPALEAAAA